MFKEMRSNKNNRSGKIVSKSCGSYNLRGLVEKSVV
ncbi:hypothetical protein BOM_1282 (plasmid) [Borrelia miyamotoi FR64b]|uniref:Uncharacterized protein n=1 Tax=Borrelia miyamotoi FR64b TaxID=1292392 RepID=W5SG19_9SPIR|nr:hypothetical protein BOM_1282 [Borrelia miyamotoi FR64b]